jgi:hypothetical protein
VGPGRLGSFLVYSFAELDSSPPHVNIDDEAPLGNVLTPCLLRQIMSSIRLHIVQCRDTLYSVLLSHCSVIKCIE